MTFVMVEREKEDGKKMVGWRRADMDIGSGGTIKFSGKGMMNKWEMTFTPEEMIKFSIEQISDTRQLAVMYGGGLLGYAMAAAMSRWIKIPVVHLEQSAGAGQKWINVRLTGVSQRKRTREVAQQIAGQLQNNGFMDIPADLNNEDVWKYPIVPVVLGCLGMIVMVVICIALIVIASAMGS